MIKVVLKHRERLHNHTETQPVRKYAQDDYFYCTRFFLAVIDRPVS
jgi:hypothetical protein